MGILDDIAREDMQWAFGDTDTFAESVTYRQGATTWSLNVCITRMPPELGDGNMVTRSIMLLIPRDPAGVIGPNQVKDGDVIMATWRIGDAAEKFVIVNHFAAQDYAAWSVKASRSI